MSPNSASGGDDSSNSGSGLPSLKKGPWTAAEDAILMEYVKKHGEGNWNAVQKNSGLSRCGKSCRLRWANHLRPNLKKGSFSPEEERLILELHAKLGNKWARMAAQLPGRTDNEIKNYWNTRIKRRQRAGLPLYPPDVQRQATLHHHHHHQRPSQSHSNIIPSLQHKTHQFSSSPALPLLDPMNFSATSLPPPLNTTTHNLLPPHFPLHNRLKRYRDSAFVAPSEFSLSYSSSSLPMFHQSFDNHHQQFGLGNFEPNVLPSIKLELPSNQFAEQATASNSNSHSGLLDALLQDSQVMSDDLGREDLLGEAVDGKCCWVGDSLAAGPVLFGESTATASTPDHEMELKTKREPTEEDRSVDRDLSTLFDIIPASMPTVPEWYSDSGEMTNALEMQQLASPLTVANEQEWALNSCTWNNMPGIC